MTKAEELLALADTLEHHGRIWPSVETDAYKAAAALREYASWLNGREPSMPTRVPLTDEQLRQQLGMPLETERENERLRVECDALAASALRLVDALKVYADPGFYHACMFMFDRPTGGFDEDFDYDEEYERAMPGKLARMTLDEVARITK